MPRIWELNPITERSLKIAKSGLNKKFLRTIREWYKHFGFEEKTGREILDHIVVDCEIYADGNRFRRLMKKWYERGFLQRALNFNGRGYIWRLSPDIEQYKDELGLNLND